SEDLVGGLSSSSSEQPIIAAISTSSPISTAVEERPTVSGSSFIYLGPKKEFIRSLRLKK
ncbi:hypothetical protein, partial [Candidatus Ichthyocystis sparus]